MYYDCSGTGSPTVVLDAGSPDTSAAWRWVQPRIAREARVCSYDRLGLGKSGQPPSGAPRTASEQVHELHALLTLARIPKPYVIVGHSWGGLLAVLFTHMYPRVVVGAVLFDPTTVPYELQRPAVGKRTPEGIDAHSAAVAVQRSVISEPSRSSSSAASSMPL